MHTYRQLISGHLQGVSRVKISEGLREFPRELFELADSLTTLDLSGNELSCLPDDFGRLHRLKTLFLSQNRFTRLPEVLADCDLDMIGFKSNQIAHIPEAALSRNTRWLILTDNRIPQLPERIGELHRLQKLMLAGNRLRTLPASLQQCHNLQLLRISANELEQFPDFLLQMPNLAWLAFAGNPFCGKLAADAAISRCKIDEFDYQERLGEGASGVIYRANWKQPPENLSDHSAVAIKQFKGHVTSDGYPEDELNASLHCGIHPNLPRVLAKIEDQKQRAVVMQLIEPGYQNLGQPPSMQSCTRDVFSPGQSYSITTVCEIARAIADVMQHLQQKQISHGDLYAHNILINSNTNPVGVLLSDFGAAAALAGLNPAQQQGLQAIEVQAFGHLLDDLLKLCPDRVHEDYQMLKSLQQRCVQSSISERPDFMQLCKELSG